MQEDFLEEAGPSPSQDSQALGTGMGAEGGGWSVCEGQDVYHMCQWGSGGGERSDQIGDPGGTEVFH